MSKFKQAGSIETAEITRTSEYAPLGCGHHGCGEIGTISHGTDGKSLFYCRNHYDPRGHTFSTNPNLARKHLDQIYEHLGFKK
jgi:hypothetical protein